MDEQTAQLFLLSAPALTDAMYRNLLHQHGSAAQALAAGLHAWRAAELPPRCCAYLSSAPDTPLNQARRWLESERRCLVMCDDPRYPVLLAQLADAPLGLFVSGDPDLLNAPQLAMVGSRNPSPYGRDLAQAFARHLSACGLCITSGLASGIDAASHRGALLAPEGRTVAVCGTGLDIVYPRSSAGLAQEIVERGALVSEFLPGTPARRHHFPQRNRLISGLSLGVLVVEATLHSGSLITARLAGDQGREVFALPGSIHSPLSKGCHQLIRQGAKLVDSAEDVLDELGPLFSTQRRLLPRTQDEAIDSQKNLQPLLDKDYKILLDALGFESLGVDQLVQRSGLPAEAVTSLLLRLELEGAVESFPGGLYLRAAQRTGPEAATETWRARHPDLSV